MADDIPVEPKIMHMTMILYFTAVIGEIPERIMPVMVPGRETSPTANRELVMGMRDALNDIFLLSS